MKRILCIFLCAVLALACFSGCRPGTTPAEPAGQTTQQPAVTDPQATEPDPGHSGTPTKVSLTDAPNLGFTDFDNQLIAFLKQTGRENENFTVSPLSFKAALALAAIGAEGETLDQILTALGHADRASLDAWYEKVLSGVDAFDAYFDTGRFDSRGDAAYQVVNAVWNNEDLPGEFRETYTADAEKQYRAEVRSAVASQLANEINAWVKEKTKGLIPSLVDDASGSSAVLVNALYLKCGWLDEFYKLGEDDFITSTGETVTKEYMQITQKFYYYGDDDTQLVVVPLQGRMSMLFVLGDETGIADKLHKASVRRVEITVPMFDVETNLNQHELVNYLKALGCDRLFGDTAEFDPMFTEPLFVSDIIQKSKVHIDEKGLEAAAATAIMMEATAAYEEPEEPVIFRADHPFSFYIVDGLETPELLFWGQLVH